jgi:4,5-DOPA dioxygenase extradiol
MKPLPTLFISHGAPPFALAPGKAGTLLYAAGRKLPAMEAVLIISPHWMTSGFNVMTGERPETFIDFAGFDPQLEHVRYAARGHPGLAAVTARLLESCAQRVRLDPLRGFDHGVWVPLLHLLPKAEVPVFQLSMPHTLTPSAAFALGKMLQPLSDQGVLIIGSGSITHNLYEFNMAASGEAAYAKEFTRWVRDKTERGDSHALIDFMAQAPFARRAHPTDEHFLPLLIALGAARKAATLEVLDGGFTYGAIGMESYIWHSQ